MANQRKGRPPVDNQGQVFGRLTVLEKEGSRKGRMWWRCQCRCGALLSVAGKNLRNGHTQSCGCLQKERASEATSKRRKGKRPTNWKGIGGMSSTHWRRILWGARVRDLDVSITHQDCADLFEVQKGQCALSGLPISFPKIGERVGSASLDRVDNTKGYVKGNVQWVDKRIQQMKSDRSMQEFVDLCHAVTVEMGA